MVPILNPRLCATSLRPRLKPTTRSIRISAAPQRGDIIREFFSNNNEGISALIQSASRYGKCTAVLESTGNMWIRIHDTLEENGAEQQIISHIPKDFTVAVEDESIFIHDALNRRRMRTPEGMA